MNREVARSRPARHRPARYRSGSRYRLPLLILTLAVAAGAVAGCGPSHAKPSNNSSYGATPNNGY